MPNSLRSRLKNLVYKGVLSQKDLDRIVIVPVDGNGDLISRQAAIDCLTATKLKKFDFILQAREEIKNLPSASTEKTGRWIRWYEVIESADGKSTDHIPHCKCSECNCEYDTYSAQFIKYCSNCGAKMEVDA